MPRRGSGRSPTPPPRRPSPQPVQQRAPVPVRSCTRTRVAYTRLQAPASAHRAAPSQGPGLMAQMAATAGGVAIGSAVGHAVGNMMSGECPGSCAHSRMFCFAGGGGHDAQQQEQQAPVNYAQTSMQPCEFELKQFLDW